MIEASTPLIEASTPLMKPVRSIHDDVVAGAHFAKGHASGGGCAAALSESLQRNAIIDRDSVHLDGLDLLASLSVRLLSSGEVSSQRSKAPCLFALGPSLR